MRTTMLNLHAFIAFPFLISFIAFMAYPLAGRTIKALALVASLIPLLFLIAGNQQWIGTEYNIPWMPHLLINFHLRVDSLTLLFWFLTAFIIPVSMFAVQSSILFRASSFFGFAFLLEGLLFIFFAARDLVLFTICWEAMLFPLYFIINIWGGYKRQYAALKFLIYMIAGSALMISAVLGLYLTAGTFDMDQLASGIGANGYYQLLFAIFFLAFAVKTPLFPFHAWLPDAYYQAPVAGTILLSALLSKAGIYGFLRIGVEMFPSVMQAWSPYLLAFSIAGVLYAGLAAWLQTDYKRLLAYSSLAHVNFILVGIFSWTQLSNQGAILQAINHGVTIAALFLVAGWLEQRLGSTSLIKASGLAKFLPLLCWFTLFFVLSSVALPGTNNFIGEFIILFGLFGQHPILTAVVGLTVILSVIYMLRWIQKVYFEEPVLYQNTWIDLKAKELAIAIPLVLVIAWIGIYPSPVLEKISQAVQNMEIPR